MKNFWRVLKIILVLFTVSLLQISLNLFEGGYVWWSTPIWAVIYFIIATMMIKRYWNV